MPATPTASAPQRTRGHCPTCNGDRNADIVAQHRETWHDEEDGAHGDDVYNVLQCAGCSSFFFQIARSSTYDMEAEWLGEHGQWGYTDRVHLTHYPPIIIRQKPMWMQAVEDQDDVLAKLLNELYDLLNIALAILPAIGARTVFDRASEMLGVNAALSFEKKLDALVAGGRIGSEERKVLEILVDAGSAAAHRGWAPRAADVSTMMDVTESFLKSNFYLQQNVQQMRQRVPPKPPRPPKANKSNPQPAALGTPATPKQLAPPSPPAGAQQATPAAPAAKKPNSKGSKGGPSGA